MSAVDSNDRPPEAHVVLARTPATEENGLAPAIYAVVAATAEQAEAAVQNVVPPNSEVGITGGPLSPVTAERLDLKPGIAKQIG